MLSPAQHARLLRAAETSRRLGLTQTQIAEALGASQGQISRILGGKMKRPSRLFEEVCLFIERIDVGVTADAVKANDELIDALKETWNGSSAHAKALATVIRATRALSSNWERPSC